jgi:phospholipid/cholesterol/gamma-HCH transport system substrate-binding protein
MIRLKNEIAVGILFFLGLAILGYFTFSMKDEIFETRQYQTMSVEFASINGLQKGERVKMFGVDVGSVTKIFLNGRSVTVRFKMYEDTPFYENYKVTVNAQSIMMGKYLSLDPGTPYTGEQENKVIDRTKPLKGATPIDVLDLVQVMLAENRDDLRASTRNMRELSDDMKQVMAKINSGQGTLGKLVNEDQTKDAKNLMKEVRDTVEDAREQAPVTSFIRSVLLFL